MNRAQDPDFQPPAVTEGSAALESVLHQIRLERARQDAKWGTNYADIPDADPVLLNRPGGATPQRLAEDVEIPTADRAKFIMDKAIADGRPHFSAILVEEVAEAVDAIGDDRVLVGELIQVAAVAVKWIQAIEQRQAAKETP